MSRGDLEGTEDLTNPAIHTYMYIYIFIIFNRPSRNVTNKTYFKYVNDLLVLHFIDKHLKVN